MTNETKALVEALHGLLFLQFRHWPLTDEDKQSGFVKNTIVPILPLVESYHASLHSDVPTGTQFVQATAADRARWELGKSTRRAEPA